MNVSLILKKGSICATGGESAKIADYICDFSFYASLNLLASARENSSGTCVYVGYRYYETRYEDVVLKAEKATR